MHTSIRRTAAVPTVVRGARLRVARFAAPVLAKEALDAQLEAPIARDTPGGTTLLLGVWLTMTDQTGTHDIDGSPVYVRVTGPDGDPAAARATQTRPGHYAARITVPASGVKAVEVGMHGSTARAVNLVASRSSRGRSPRGPRRSRRPTRRDRARGACVGAGAARGPGGRACRIPTTVAPVAAPVEAGPGPLVLGALVLRCRGPRDAGHLPPPPDHAHPRLSGRSPGA